MSTYDDASLITYPSGYKSGVIYSQKPTDGSGDLTFTRASTARRLNESGLIESVASGVPRIDYTGGGCGKLLLEPQRTNYFLHSNDFNNAAWTKTNVTITSDEIASPISGEMADSVMPTATTSQHRVLQGAWSLVNGTFTCYIKKKELSRICIHLLGANVGRGFDCNDNTTFLAVGIAADASSWSIEDAGNGWSKCTVTTTSATAVTRVDIYIANPTPGGNNSVWTGDGTSKIYISAAQFENATTSTSYIPTAGATSTRLVDTSTTTGLSSVIGQTEGTVILNGSQLDRGLCLLMDDTTSNNVIGAYIVDEIGRTQFYITKNGTTYLFDTLSTAYNKNAKKVGFVYTATTFKVFIDGVKVKDEIYASLNFSGTLSRIQLGSVGERANLIVDEFIVLPTALTDTELATLTTI